LARLRDLRLDVDLATEGVWRHYRDGAYFRIARQGNDRYRAFMREHGRDLRGRLRFTRKGGVDLSGMSPDDTEAFAALQRRAQAETVVTGMRGVDADPGPISAAEYDALEPGDRARYRDLWKDDPAAVREARSVDEPRWQEQLEYSPALMLEWLEDPTMSPWQEWVSEESQSDELFHSAGTEAALGN
jgi:hypothetical protein